jgi:hypothetical protein
MSPHEQSILTALGAPLDAIKDIFDEALFLMGENRGYRYSIAEIFFCRNT